MLEGADKAGIGPRGVKSILDKLFENIPEGRPHPGKAPTSEQRREDRLRNLSDAERVRAMRDDPDLQKFLGPQGSKAFELLDNNRAARIAAGNQAAADNFAQRSREAALSTPAGQTAGAEQAGMVAKERGDVPLQSRFLTEREYARIDKEYATREGPGHAMMNSFIRKPLEAGAWILESDRRKQMGNVLAALHGSKARDEFLEHTAGYVNESIPAPPPQSPPPYMPTSRQALDLRAEALQQNLDAQARLDALPPAQSPKNAGARAEYRQRLRKAEGELQPPTQSPAAAAPSRDEAYWQEQNEILRGIHETTERMARARASLQSIAVIQGE